MSLKSFFYLHKADRQVLLAFLLIAAIALGCLFVLEQVNNEKMQAEAADSLSYGQTANGFQHDNSLLTKKGSGNIIYADNSKGLPSPQRFFFDPNTADSTQLLLLGLRPWQVRNIYKYRAAGGIYGKKEDFAKLYGLTVKQYRELEPYIRISPDYLPAATLVHTTPQQRDTLLYPRKITEGETIDLSVADTTQLKRVPGIGHYFAHEIVKLRQRLGGFAHVDQLDEIDLFPQDAKRYFVIEAQATVRLNLNKLSLNELKRHPYINYYQARAIIDYRRQNGPLHSLDDLRLLPAFTPKDLHRLAPYVEF